MQELDPSNVSNSATPTPSRGWMHACYDCRVEYRVYGPHVETDEAGFGYCTQCYQTLLGRLEILYTILSDGSIVYPDGRTVRPR